MKRFIFFIVIFGAFFTFSASAETDSVTYEMYDRQYEASGTENLKDMTPPILKGLLMLIIKIFLR